MSQGQRDRAMSGFRNGKFDILVATDIVARGIDVSQVSHVINYDIPNTPDAYTHRIGRTGRAERSGKAYTFVTDDDRSGVWAIERKIQAKIPRCQVTGFEGVTIPDAPAGGRGEHGGKRPGARTPGRRRAGDFVGRAARSPRAQPRGGGRGGGGGAQRDGGGGRSRSERSRGRRTENDVPRRDGRGQGARDQGEGSQGGRNQGGGGSGRASSDRRSPESRSPARAASSKSFGAGLDEDYFRNDPSRPKTARRTDDERRRGGGGGREEGRRSDGGRSENRGGTARLWSIRSSRRRERRWRARWRPTAR